jgi:hypothetical protein
MLLQRDDVFRFFAPAIASIANCQSSIGKYLSCCLYSFVTSSIITFFSWILIYITSIIIYRQKYPHFIPFPYPSSPSFNGRHTKLLEVWSCWMSATSQGPQHRPPWIGRDGAAGSCDAKGINGGPMMGLSLGDWIIIGLWLSDSVMCFTYWCLAGNEGMIHNH